MKHNFKKLTRQLGQGMTEYIIIVALIAIAAIAVYGFFGDTLRGQMGAISQELSGVDGGGTVTAAQGSAASAAGEAAGKDLSTYTAPAGGGN